MEFEIPNRHILRPTSSVDMIQRVLRWERQKRCYGRKNSRAHDRENCSIQILIHSFGGEEKMKTKEWSNLVFLQKCSF